MEINDILTAKLASIAVHAGEVAAVTTSSISTVQLLQLQALVQSDEVQQFIKNAGALAPMPRRL
jgi:hypothetical protein